MYSALLQSYRPKNNNNETLISMTENNQYISLRGLRTDIIKQNVKQFVASKWISR